MLPESLRRLIAAAGRAHADERRRAEAQHAADERERAAFAEAEARARREVATNAATTWTWLESAEGDEVRAAMREYGVERLRLGVWNLVTGAPCDVGFGTVTLQVVADAVALHVNVACPCYVGHRSRRVHSAVELADLVPALALAAFAQDVRAGRVTRERRGVP